LKNFTDRNVKEPRAKLNAINGERLKTLN